RGVRGEQGRQAQPGAPEAEADATAKILVNQSLSDATYLLVHCYPSNGCVVVHAAKFWRKSSGDNTLTATASFTRFGSSGHFTTLLLLMSGSSGHFADNSMALRRSPKPGAFTAATLRPPRSLLTTSVASASPSTSSAMMSSGLPVCTTASSSGKRSLSAESFFS